VSYSTRAVVVRAMFVGALLLGPWPFFITSSKAAGISFVQRASADAGTTTHSTLAFPHANAAGNWIAVCVRAGRSGESFTVSDSHSNIYRRAAQLNITVDTPNGDTVAIFYAENISSGSNTVTVSDTILSTLRFAVFEYAGVAPSNSLDVSAGAQGVGSSASSGNITPGSAGELVLAALATADGRSYTASNGFVLESSVPVLPNSKLVAEDRVQTSAGTIAATASLSSSDPWGAIVAAFRPNGTATSPRITQLNPSSGAVGQSVTISGTNFGTSASTGTLQFNRTTAHPTSWSNTAIVAPVPSGATSGNVVITVSGMSSNGMNFTVSSSAPAISGLSPNSGPIGSAVTVTGSNFGGSQGSSRVTFNGASATATSWGSTTISTTVPAGANTGNVVVTVAGASSNGMPFTVSATTSSMGPLKQSGANTRYFVTPAGSAVFLSGSHTWNDFQDTDTNVGGTPAAMDFNAFVNTLQQNGHNVTILWHKDLPEYCGWNFGGSVWRMDPWPWLRPGPGVATDGGPKFDLTQFNQTYFARLRARVQQLQQNGIYAIIELFDANQLTSARCSTDGYPFSGPNNINGVSDGYSSGSSGAASYTMTSNNTITNFQDAYVKKTVDTLNDLPNVIWQVAEEEPAASMSWWAPHVMGLLRAYEGGGTFEGATYSAKPFQHPVGIGALNASAPNDATLYASTSDWIAPTVNSNWSDQFPSNVSTNNQGKVVINDSDHALGYKSLLNSDGSVRDQNLRGYLWENLTNGAEGVIFMDPYEIFWQGSPVRNTCLNPANQVCTGGVDAKYNNFRAVMGHLQRFVNANLNLLRMTPQNSLSSTGHCLADNSATGAEYLVYAPNGGTVTVNLTATSRVLNVKWLNPATGVITAGAAVSGGSTQSFTAPFGGDAVLYLVDANGHN
jgi:IPT/TIG domain/Family of unknown function (DUF6298)/Putative collagen-binding domain of a collagenase